MTLLYSISVFLISIGIVFTIIKYSLNIFQRPRYKLINKIKTKHKTPIFSVHIPTRAEPFEVVKKCIESVVPQLREQDEIIILDNNHDSIEDYQELESFCKQNNILFKHFDHISGYKAGALNKAIELSKNNATHIIVIDCDYILKENAFKKIISNIELYPEYDFIQFPQAYFDNKVDIINELNKYFNYNLSLPLNNINVLGTGTLCVIDIGLLYKMNGWPTSSITEDAQFGINTQNLDKKGIFINEVIGRGMTPSTIRDFIGQRKRWIYGNAQVFLQLFRKYNKKTFKQSNISQLSTWLNFTCVTVFLHIFFLVLIISGRHINQNIFYLIYAHYGIILIFKVFEFSKLRISNSEKIKAFSINWGTFWISTFYWVPAIFGLSKGFIRTPKVPALNSNYYNIPILFLLLHILTIAVIDFSPLIFTIIMLFILLDIFSKFIYIQNYRI